MPRPKLVLALFALLLAAGPALADPPRPDEVVLVVAGDVIGGSIEFDAAHLAAMPQHTIRTSTAWTEGIKTFEGVLVRDLLEPLGARHAETARLSALNDYAIDVPVGDFYRYDVILAMRMDGVPLTRRDKGPLWVVYPRDDVDELKDERYDSRWVWQLNRIELL